MTSQMCGIEADAIVRAVEGGSRGVVERERDIRDTGQAMIKIYIYLTL